MCEPTAAAQDSRSISAGPFHGSRCEPGGNNAMSAQHPGSARQPAGKPADISEEAVRRQLGCILDSPEFKNKPMICGFLSHVVEETLAGRAHEIKGYTIATQVFGRKKDFDPTIDPIVRIQAGRLRRILESYYSGAGRQDQLRIEVGKGNYVPSFSVSVPEKLRLPHPGGSGVRPAQDEISPDLSKPYPFPTADCPSIAVLPLVNLTNDPDQEYLSMGLAEELMSGLARCHGLQVNASHSIMCWKADLTGVRQPGRDLDVRFLVGGSLRKEGNTIKFAFRLIDADTLTQIWGEQYKYSFEPEKMIDLQEDVARKVTAKIGGIFGAIVQKLSKESRSGPLHYLETYQAFIRFSQYLLELSPQTHLEALQALERALLKDPASGVALSMLAFLHANEYVFVCPDKSERIDKAVAWARHGVSVEPENQIVRALFAYILFVSGQKKLFFQEAEHTLLLDAPMPDAVGLLGWAMALYGEWDRGIALLEKAMYANPYRPGWFHLAPYLNYFRQGKFEEAYYEAEKFNTPHLFWGPLVRVAALGCLGKRHEAKSAVEALLEIRADFLACGRKITGFFLKDPNLHCSFFEGLRKAGLDTA